MRFDSQQTFDYPVLRTGSDDYAGKVIQTSVDIAEIEGEIHRFQVTVQHRVQEIADLCSEGSACYCVSVVCRDTFTQETRTSNSPNLMVDIPSDRLLGIVTLSTYVLVSAEQIDYRSVDFNREYGVQSFRLSEGALLALCESEPMFFERSPYRNLSSCFEIQTSSQVPVGEYHIDCSSESVRILVSKLTKQSLMVARNQADTRSVLMASVYLSATMQCLYELHDNPALNSTKWAQAFHRRLQQVNLPLEVALIPQIAQRMLSLPIRAVAQYYFEVDVPDA